MKRLLITLACLVPVSPVLAETLVVDRARLVEIVGPVMGEAALEATKLVELSESSKDPIYVFLNGPGGSVFASQAVILGVEIAKARGVEVRCLASFMAMSAQFNIFSRCSKRFAFAGTKLLFHPVRMGLSSGTAFTAPEAARIAEELAEIDSAELDFLCSTMGDGDSDKCQLITKAYWAERIWNAKDLLAAFPGFLTIVKDVQGLPNLLKFE